MSKESACSAGDAGNVGLIPGSGRSPGVGNGNPTRSLIYQLHSGTQHIWAAYGGSALGVTSLPGLLVVF